MSWLLPLSRCSQGQGAQRALLCVEMYERDAWPYCWMDRGHHLHTHNPVTNQEASVPWMSRVEFAPLTVKLGESRNPSYPTAYPKWLKCCALAEKCRPLKPFHLRLNKRGQKS
jgi:hypothetical protein